MCYSQPRGHPTPLGETLETLPTKIKHQAALPWWSSGSDSELPMQGSQAQPLVGELRSRMPELFLTCKTSNTKRECPLLLLLFNMCLIDNEIRKEEN